MKTICVIINYIKAPIFVKKLTVLYKKSINLNLFNHQKLLKDIIDLNHPLVKLADSIDWKSIEKELSLAFPSKRGHFNKPIRLMVGFIIFVICLI